MCPVQLKLMISKSISGLRAYVQHKLRSSVAPAFAINDDLSSLLQAVQKLWELPQNCLHMEGGNLQEPMASWPYQPVVTGGVQCQIPAARSLVALYID